MERYLVTQIAVIDNTSLLLLLSTGAKAHTSVINGGTPPQVDSLNSLGGLCRTH